MVPDSGNATGRLMVAGRSKGMARNFSCGNFIVVCGMYFDTYDNGLIPVNSTGDLWAALPTFCSAWGPGQCSGGNQVSSGSATYYWTIGATSIIKATSSAQLTVQSPQVTGVSPGTGSGYASVEGGGCSAGGSGGCDVQRPNEIFATNDATGTANCPLTSVARTITYTIEDSTGSPMGTPVPIHENVPVTSSSCNSSLVHTGSGCVLNNLYQPGTLNQFNDYIWAGCPSSASVEPCGFQFSNQQWQFCPASQSPTSIGTVGPVNAGNAIISVHGNITSLVGTTFGP